MIDCIFCEKYKEKENSIFGENKFFYYHLDKFPVTPGHIEIVSKRHAESILDLTKEEWKYLQIAIKDAINILENKLNLKKIYTLSVKNPINEKSERFLNDAINSSYINKKPKAYNHGNNDGHAAGRTIDHFHWHIIPRYDGDVKNPMGGIRHIIAGKENYQ